MPKKSETTYTANVFRLYIGGNFIFAYAKTKMGCTYDEKFHFLARSIYLRLTPNRFSCETGPHKLRILGQFNLSTSTEEDNSKMLSKHVLSTTLGEFGYPSNRFKPPSNFNTDLMVVNIMFNSVLVAEWSPFGKDLLTRLTKF